MIAFLARAGQSIPLRPRIGVRDDMIADFRSGPQRITPITRIFVSFVSSVVEEQLAVPSRESASIGVICGEKAVVGSQ
jgi:hypothetical protein